MLLHAPRCAHADGSRWPLLGRRAARARSDGSGQKHASADFVSCCTRWIGSLVHLIVIIFQIGHEPAELEKEFFYSNKDVVFDDKNIIQYK